MTRRAVAGPWRTAVALVAVVVTAGLLWWQAAGGTTPAETPAETGGGLPVVAVADLPPEAHVTLALIEDGGPYPYDQDDGVFSNREELLPERPEGYYREYTVGTPGSPDRGPRRIVAGSEGERYWTDDHYASFRRIIE